MIPLGDLPSGPGVYVLHLSEPLAHARGYVGWAADIARRVTEHLDVEACRQAGFHVASHRGSPWSVLRSAVGAPSSSCSSTRAAIAGSNDACITDTTRASAPSVAASARCSRAESAFEGASAALTARQPIVRD